MHTFKYIFPMVSVVLPQNWSVRACPMDTSENKIFVSLGIPVIIRYVTKELLEAILNHQKSLPLLSSKLDENNENKFLKL